MIKLAKKRIRSKLIRVTQKYHRLLLESDFDSVYETLITPESADLLASTAWPLIYFKEDKIDFLIDSKFNPNPDVPIHDALSLAFQMDEEGCRSGLFQAIAAAVTKYRWNEFNRAGVLAFVDESSAVLAADTPTTKPIFMLFVRQDNGEYLVDFESLWLFSMEMRASFLCEIASRAVQLGNKDLALEYYKIASGLDKSYTRIRRLMCQHPIIGQFVNDTRKREIDEEIKYTSLAKERVQLLTTTAEREHLISLTLEQYEKILQTLANMASVMERSPEAFWGLREEHLRDHFLVQLSGQFGGDATGETFNFGGKTDILIRRDNTNLFVAECKFWRGPKQFTETINQLLGYATWRDTRLAMLIFNRGGDLSTILSKIPDLVKSHNSFSQEVDYASETGFRFLIKHPDDVKRELILTVLVFEIPRLPNTSLEPTAPSGAEVASEVLHL
jgi:hypothetical protein